MPDHRRSRRSIAALALTAGALTLAVASPTVSAQETEADPWKGSEFDAAVTEIHETSTFDVSGVFVRTDEAPIARVDVSFDYDSHPSADTEGCPIPDEANNIRPPEADPEPTPDPETPPPPDPETPETRRRFVVADTEWPCNGTYTAAAVARATSPDSTTKELVASIRVAVPPAPVPSIEATVAGGEDAPDPETGATPDDPATVLVSWEQLADPDGEYPDFVGYRVQRAGPAEGSKFETVSDPVIDHDGEKVTREFTDTIEAPGDYRYRVQSLRPGVDGPGKPVPSGDNTASVTVEIAGPPTTTTTAGPPTTRSRLGLPSVGRGTNNPRAPLTVPAVPTTVDTGFDEELDYGDLPEPGEELAGEGQSVIQNEGEGAGLLGPVAGAMVLLGWAGHVAYLNRLAKQF